MRGGTPREGQYSGPGVELPYAGINTFLKSDRRRVDDLDDGVDVAVLGAPFDGGVTNRPGARYGPAAIRRASSWWGYLFAYAGAATDVRTGETFDVSDLTITDCGDVPVFPTEYEETAAYLTTYVERATETSFPVLLGGDHSLTFPAARGVASAAAGDRIGLVQIDAHSDTVPEDRLFGTQFHGSFAHLVADSPFSGYENVSQVAIRGFESPNFHEFVDDTGLNLFTMAEIRRRGVRPVVEEAVERAADGVDEVYVTFDVDAIDPGVAPGTGTPCPGGLTSQQALEAVDVLGSYECIGAFDLMEVAPSYDPTGRTQKLAALLVVTLLEHLDPTGS